MTTLHSLEAFTPYKQSLQAAHITSFLIVLIPLINLSAICQIVDVLTYISKKESFDLPTSLAATIASQSRQNLREAILALEACKANKYDRTISLIWKNQYPLELYHTSLSVLCLHFSSTYQLPLC